MGSVQKISVALTEELAGHVEAAVTSGDYATASEVIRDALRGWLRERSDREAAIRRLRFLWEEGLASGEPVPMPDDWAEQIKERSRTRLAARRKAG